MTKDARNPTVVVQADGHIMESAIANLSSSAFSLTRPGTTARAGRGAAMALVLTLVACAPKGPVESAPPPPPTPPLPQRAAQVVNATILANRCQEFGQANGKLAEKAMYELVEGCASVPGGTAQFGATLLPGGRIEIASAPGQPDLVPICILKHPLSHRVPLSKPCRLDVKIEQTSVPVGLDAG